MPQAGDLFLGNFVGGLWLFVIGSYVQNASRASYRQMFVREALRGETVARFRVAIGDETFLADFLLGMRTPVYVPFPEQLALDPDTRVTVYVKSDGSTTVRAFAILVGTKVE
mgnify:CR=1 FL=1